MASWLEERQNLVPEFILQETPRCSEVDPDLFFTQEAEVDGKILSSRYKYLAEAKKICSACPLQMMCLEYAIKNAEIGIWGGTTEQQRSAIMRHRGSTPNVKQKLH